MKIKHLLTVSALAALMTACTGMQSKYGCSGLPDGIVCKSPMQVYDQTNSDDRMGVYQSDLEEQGGPKSKYDKGSSGKKQTQAEQMVNLFAKPQFQAASSPMPVLEQPKVLRIWVAPWKDENETLNWSSYLFTEITPRRWNFGDSVMRNTPVTAPNKADYMSPSTTTPPTGDGNAANAEAAQIMSMNTQVPDQSMQQQPNQQSAQPQTPEMQRQQQLAESGGFQ